MTSPYEGHPAYETAARKGLALPNVREDGNCVTCVLGSFAAYPEPIPQSSLQVCVLVLPKVL